MVREASGTVQVKQNRRINVGRLLQLINADEGDLVEITIKKVE